MIRTALFALAFAALYDNAGGFLKQPVGAEKAKADKAGTTLVFRDVAPGDYGFAVFQDTNDNGRMGPSDFAAVKLAVPAAGLDTSVTLR